MSLVTLRARKLLLISALAGALMAPGLSATAVAQGTPPVSITDGQQLSDYAFDPGEFTVAAGGTVSWTNNGSQPHTVTASDRSFDSGLIAPGDTFDYTFADPGTYSYVCTPHPWMKATIVVSDAS